MSSRKATRPPYRIEDVDEEVVLTERVHEYVEEEKPEYWVWARGH